MDQESQTLFLKSINDLTKETQRLAILVATIEERVSNMIQRDLEIMKSIEHNKLDISKNTENINVLNQYKSRMIGFITALSMLSGSAGYVTTQKLLAILNKDKNPQEIFLEETKGE
jgi:hypothetical protein